MSKRKLEVLEQSTKKKAYNSDLTANKHSLDSDEEDNVDEDNRLDPEDIEGEVEGFETAVGGERITAFNMREELEEGHFDRHGYFIWNNEKEIKDNWLDHIDWQQIETSNTKYNLDPSEKISATDSDSEPENLEEFDEIETYRSILTYMKPNETIYEALRRLAGDDGKLSSVERLKRRKAGTLKTNEGVTKLTEFANKILTEKGDMDIYKVTYESISNKIEPSMKMVKGGIAKPELDMYAVDFVEKEKENIEVGTSTSVATSERKSDNIDKEV